MLKDEDVFINIVDHGPKTTTNKAQIKKEKYAERFLKKKERGRTPNRTDSSVGKMYEKTEEPTG